MSFLGSKGERCCDPFNTHRRPITQNLRIITAVDVSKASHLTAGSFICDNCRKVLRGTDSSSSSSVVPENRGSRSSSRESRQSHSVDQTREECCNPFKLHSKPIHKGLRLISDTDRKRCKILTLNDIVWCDTCRKHEPKDTKGVETLPEDFELADLFKEISEDLTRERSEPNSQEVGAGSTQSSDSCSPSLSPAVLMESSKRHLTQLGASPLCLSGVKTDAQRAAAAKRKIDQASEIITKKVCLAAGIKDKDLPLSPKSRKAKDHDLLMEEVKEKFPSASKLQKYQLLSLVPASWSTNETAAFFGISRNLVKSAQELRKGGILPVTEFKRKSSVLESTKNIIKDFYCLDENSKVMPGIRDCVSVSPGVYEQKRLLLCDVSELYESFKTNYKDLKVGLSMFYSLRPKWCVFCRWCRDSPTVCMSNTPKFQVNSLCSEHSETLHRID